MNGGFRRVSPVSAPAGHSIPSGRFVIATYPWFIGGQRVHAIRIGTLPVADRDHDCPLPLQTLNGRGSFALGVIAQLVPEFSRPIKVARFALAWRASEVS
jgi:hypothetical protein